MTPTGDRGKKIREQRLSLDWTQGDLSRVSGVSVATISRIETDRDYESPRSLTKVERALGIGTAPRSDPATSRVTSADDVADALRSAPAGQLIAELARRLSEHEHLTVQAGQGQFGHDRIRTETELPPGFTDRPGLIRGPAVERQGDEAAGSDT